MPYVPISEGRAYAPFIALRGDPQPLANTGKLYSKLDGGIAQLFFQADDGTVYQLTPVSGSAGQIADFIYDPGGVQAGNIYTTFSDVVAAANATGANARVKLAQAATPFNDATLGAAGSYDVSSILFWSDTAEPPPLLWFGGADLIGSTNLMFHNIIIQNSGAGALCSSAVKPVDCVFSGNGGITPTVGGPIFYAANGNLVTVEFREQSQMQRTSFPVQKYFDGDGTAAIQVRTTCELDKGAIRNPPWQISDFCTANAFVTYYDNSNTPIQSDIESFMGTQNQLAPQGRRSNGGLNQNNRALTAGTYTDYDPEFNFSMDVLRVAPTGVVTITGLRCSIPDPTVFPNQAFSREITVINAGPGTVVLEHDGGSVPENRFLMIAGLDFTLAINEAARLLYDVTTKRWRAFRLT